MRSLIWEFVIDAVQRHSAEFQSGFFGKFLLPKEAEGCQKRKNKESHGLWKIGLGSWLRCTKIGFNF